MGRKGESEFLPIAETGESRSGASPCGGDSNRFRTRSAIHERSFVDLTGRLTHTCSRLERGVPPTFPLFACKRRPSAGASLRSPTPIA